MLKRYWVIFAAFGINLSAHAQDSEWTPQERSPIEENQPTEVEGGVGHGWQFPVIIVENPEQAAHAQERERYSDEHEAADLDAQVRSANAAERSAATAERQEIPAWMQIWLAIASTVIAVIALAFSIISSVRSERLGQAQVRAYLSIENVLLRRSEGVRQLSVGFTVRNSGQSPARSVEVFVIFRLIGGMLQSDGSVAPAVTFLRETKFDLNEIPANNARVNPVTGNSDLMFEGSAIASRWGSLAGVSLFFVITATDVFGKEISHYAFGDIHWRGLPTEIDVLIDSIDQQGEPFALADISQVRTAGSKYGARRNRRSGKKP